MTPYQYSLKLRLETKLDQMCKVHEHATQLYEEGKSPEEIQVWVNLFDELEAEAEVLILIRDIYSIN
jgi:hypothetical protein